MQIRSARWIAVFVLGLVARAASQDAANPTDDPLRLVREGRAPETVVELRALEAQVQQMLERVLPATVSLDGASGVMIDGGYVLTAGHVTREPGRSMRIRLHDGRMLRGESLGLNMRTDTGLIKVLGEGEYPTCPLGHSGSLRVGQWCVMLGHPSGFKVGRSAPARLGRVLRVPTQGFLVTDCTMQGGDSGGPLFDLDGNVIGINSRISASFAQNMHVPADAFHSEWEDLIAGKVVQAPARGGDGAQPSRLGLRFRSGDGVVVREVVAGSPAANAGLISDDAIVAVNGTPVASRIEYARAFRARTDDRLLFAVRRGDETIDVEVDLGRRTP